MAHKTAVKGKSPEASQEVSRNKPKSYASHGVKDNDIFLLPAQDYQIMGVLTVLGLFVRLFKIHQPASVVFDEVHFGGFASKYIKGKFFMDVHPPLAKLLITLAGWLAGFNGDFDFKEIGKDYLEPGVPYVAMRLLPALMGVLTIPTIFLTLKASGCRTSTAAMGSALLIFENGLLTQSRLILLDSPLIFLTAFTALAFTCFTNQQEQGPAKAFDATWWFWLAATGLGLGATASVKWVGLFTIAWVGSLTVLQLWVLLADTRNVSPRIWSKHLLARVFCLICIPVAFYMALFGIHFICLVNPGDGDGFMSSEFQATLNSKGMQDVPADVVLGSRVSIRHHNTQGGYLHSHNHMYPTGSKQQQITLYPHKDDNNVFLLENSTQPLGPDGQAINGTNAWDNIAPTHLKDGDVIRLFHITTSRRLHSHDVRPPITEADWQNEVSAYGYDGFEGDANDLFRVEIQKSYSEGEAAKTRVRTIQTKFKLVHVMTGCSLFSHKVKLPEWGFEQQEVTCAKQGTLPNSIWYIESNIHPQLGPGTEMVNYRNPGFLGKFWELQQVMWRTNAGLVDSHAWDSRPPSWPILSRGINFWGKNHRQIYLIGNPVIWWSSTLAILAYAVFKGIAVIRWQRGFKDYENVEFKRFDYEIGPTVLGWAFHYFPFFLMSRQLFLHHYFPALYFAIIALCQIYDFGANRFSGLGIKQRPAIGRGAMVLFLCVSITAFTVYAPLSYGNPWTKAQCGRSKVIGTWDWDCNNFLDDYAAYANINENASSISQTAAAASRPLVDPQADVKAREAVSMSAEKLIKLDGSVEYRDGKGSLIDEQQAKEYEGKGSLSTRSETAKVARLGEDGHVINPVGQDESVAPPHPDAEQGTKAIPEKDAQQSPPSVSPGDDLKKEQSVEKAKGDSAKPASEANEATKAE